MTIDTTRGEFSIVHETPTGHYVLRERGRYSVLRHAGTHAVLDSAYNLDADGLSIAIARCNYLETLRG